MAAGQARALKEKTGRQVAIVDQYGRARRHEIWVNNSDVATVIREDTLRIRNCSGHRPYIASKSATRWVWKPFTPTPARIVFYPKEEQFGQRHGTDKILIEPNVKSIGHTNKQWFWERWQELADRHPGQFVQVGTVNSQRLDGVEFVLTTEFRQAAAILRYARAYVGPEGGLHHAAAALSVPAVVLFGGFISPESTGYATHRNLFTGGQACGMRVDCKHCRAAMDAITVDLVDQHLTEVLDEVR